jgi:hypothetical protein
VQIDGKAVESPADVRDALAAVRAGQVVELMLEAPEALGGESQIVNVRMPAR